MLPDWLPKWLKCLKRSTRKLRPATKRERYRLTLEQLEGRWVPSNIVPLASFNPGSNGANPQGGVIEDSSGNLFGTTNDGGPSGDGTVFEVAQGSNTITVLASFNGTNGANPQGGVVEDSSGNLFGTTYGGGKYNYGTLFEVAHGSSTITTLASFNGTNGAFPVGALVEDSSGNLFGTAEAGTSGDGTVFEVAQGSNTITVLASFHGGNGAFPVGALVEDSSGNLFGTTYYGGTSGAGTVFEVAHNSNTISTLASFNFTNGAIPYFDGLVEDSSGNLFGTTSSGGPSGDGTVFEVVQGSNTITVLASFNGSNGAGPEGGLVEDSSGNLFGTTTGDGPSVGGTLFEVAQGSNTITTLASFYGGTGATPEGGLVEDSSGNFFGTTYRGGTFDTGTVFELDTVAPTVTLTAPANNSFTANNKPTLSASAADNPGGTGLASVQFQYSADAGATWNNVGSPETSGPFSFTFTSALANGSYQARAIATDNAGNSATSTPVTFTIATATQLAITNVSSSSVTAGGTVTFTVTAEDASNNPVTGYTGTVQLTSTDTSALFGGAPLPATYTFVPGDNGAHSFTVTLQTAGSKTITVTDQANSSFTATTSPITVAAGTFSKYALSVPGGNTVVADESFILTAQAVDASGNTVSTYSGPTSGTLSASPTDPLGNFPNSIPLNSSGVGVFLGKLNTAGTYTITITAGTFTGLIANIKVTAAVAGYFTVVAPASATTGVGFDVAVSAFDRFGNTASGYTGTIKLTSTDPAAPTPVASYTFVAGDSGAHTFHNVTLSTAGAQTITATQTSAPVIPLVTGTSNTVTMRRLVVTALTPTPTGFKVAFSKPFVPANVTLYGPGPTVQDVILSGTIHGSIGGSLIVDPTGMSAEFKATADTLNFFNGGSSIVLPDDKYTVTLVSGVSNGFSDGTAGLDGGGGIGGNGGHANFVFTFPASGTTHYQSSATPVLAIADFARGPNDGATIQIPIVGQSTLSSGIPITLYNAAGVTDATFTLTYNPALFVLNATSTSTLDSTGTGTKTFTLTSSVTGTATFHYTNTVAQTTGTLILGDILATDPSSSKTSYGVKDLMTLSSVTVNGSAFSGVVANGIHVNTYFGDVSGDGRIDAVDVAKIAVVSAAAPGVDTGFVAYQQLNPAIVGDVASDVSIDAGDLSTLKGYLLHLPAPLMSATPGFTGIVSPNAADPVLSLAIPLTPDPSPPSTGERGAESGLNPSAGDGGRLGVLPVEVMLDHPHPEGSTGVSEAVLALIYDPSVLSVSASDITLGTLPGKDWTLVTDVDASKGQIGIQVFGMTPITATQGGSLVNIALHVRPDATVGATAVQLVDSVTPSGQQYGTALADDQSGLVLGPGMDRVIIDTGVAPALAPAPTSTEHVVERQAPTVSEETGTSLVPRFEDGLLVLSNGAVAGETMHTVPADLVVSGALAFQSNMATLVRAGQVFQLGSAPALNSLLYANSPGQLAVDRLFLALARGTDAVAEFNSLSLFQDNLWVVAAQHPDWRAIQSSAPGTRTDFLRDVEQPVWDPIANLDKIFVALGDEIDDPVEN